MVVLSVNWYSLSKFFIGVSFRFDATLSYPIFKNWNELLVKYGLTYISIYGDLRTFIDDLTAIYFCYLAEAREAKLNTCHPSIKLDYKFSKISRNFLNTTVYKNKGQKIAINNSTL